MQVTFYGAFVNWLTNRTLTLTPLPRQRGSFYRLSLWERPTRESAAVREEGVTYFLNAC